VVRRVVVALCLLAQACWFVYGTVSGLSLDSAVGQFRGIAVGANAVGLSLSALALAGVMLRWTNKGVQRAVCVVEALAIAFALIIGRFEIVPFAAVALFGALLKHLGGRSQWRGPS
jgi:hypothetical protein